jgi:hypothetical protein
MSNYKYEYKKHQLTGAPCIYPAFYVEHSSTFPKPKAFRLILMGIASFMVRIRPGKSKMCLMKNSSN